MNALVEGLGLPLGLRVHRFCLGVFDALRRILVRILREFVLFLSTLPFFVEGVFVAERVDCVVGLDGCGRYYFDDEWKNFGFE